MNGLVLAAGAIAALVTAGHFAVGTRLYLAPMLVAGFDAVPKRTMHAVFHYVSAFLVLSALALLAVGTGLVAAEEGRWLVRFVAANYAVFAVWLVGLAVTSGIPGALFKLFQWMLFLSIALLAGLGSLG